MPSAAMNGLTKFDFKSNTIRVVQIDGEPRLVARDICEVLGLRPKHAMSRVDADERGLVARTDLGDRPGRPMHVVSESGLYKLIMRSDEPSARPFQDWVTKVVLPAIRKDGGYIAGEEKVATGELSEAEGGRSKNHPRSAIPERPNSALHRLGIACSKNS